MTNQAAIDTQPHSVEAERTVLGALLLDPDAIFKVDAKLTADDFYDPTHRSIYAAIQTVVEKGIPVDCVTVSDCLNSDERIGRLGGSRFLTTLVDEVPTASHVTHYTEIVLEKSRRRQLEQLGRRLATLAHEDKQSANQLTELAEQAVFKLSRQAATNEPMLLRDLRAERFDHYVQVHEADDPSQVCGLPCGFSTLDAKLTGLAPGQLIVLAGRPGMGKTALALDVAWNVANEQGKSVLVCSLEMTKEELFGRLSAKALSVPAWRLERGSLDDQEFDRIGTVFDGFDNVPLYIDDDTDTSLTNIRSKARCHKMRNGLDLLIIDYLQLMEVTDKAANENPTQRVTYMTRTLKRLARELHCPIVLLSQLSRACEHRTDKRPVASDLRESGSIEQDADKIVMLYRDSEYYEDCDDPDCTEVLIRKNRNGPKGCVPLHFSNETMSFEDRVGRAITKQRAA